MRTSLRSASVLAAALAIACAGGGSQSASPGATTLVGPGGGGGGPAIALERAFPRLSFPHPTDLQSPPDGTDRLFVLEQPGRIRVFPNRQDVASAGVFLDIRSRVDSSDTEMGLLGLAFDPGYRQNRTFYVNYTAGRPRRTVIARYKATADADRADPASEEVILTYRQPYTNHKGGQLAFGPDGMLYIGTGDGGWQGDPHGNGQRRDTLLAKWLRIDVHRTSKGRKYAIPPDNPYAGNQQGFREEIYAYGLRNLWRFSYDPETRRWYGGDVGQNRLEEVDILEKGKNYGWNLMEGTQCYAVANCDRTGLTLPIAEYGRREGVSITGGYVYRGDRVPSLQGAYVYADWGSGRFWALRYDGQRVTENRVLLNAPLNPTSFGLDQHRELYVLDYEGGIYRFR